MPTSNGPSPAGALHLALAAAAFDHAAQTSAAWAASEDQETATRMFTGLAELLRIELSDPQWSTQTATLEAVSLVSHAFSVAATNVRRTDTAHELGHGEVKQQGCAYAADWLQAQADMFALFAAQLVDRLPPSEHRGQVKFTPASESGRPTVEFATLAVAQNGLINVTVHRSEPEATAYYHEYFQTDDSDHRVDRHTVGLADAVDHRDQNWLHNSPTVELTTLVVVQDSQIVVSVHGTESAAYVDLLDRFPGPNLRQLQYRIDSHEVDVYE